MHIKKFLQKRYFSKVVKIVRRKKKDVEVVISVGQKYVGKCKPDWQVRRNVR